MTSLQKLIVKGTHDQLPGTSGGHGRTSSPLWEAVANECQQNPGQWVAFEIPGRNARGLGSARTHIKAGKYTAFKDGAWDAAVRGAIIYVKYLGEASAEVVDFRKSEVA